MSRCNEKSIQVREDRRRGAGGRGERVRENQREGGERETAASQEERDRAAIKHRGTFSSHRQKTAEMSPETSCVLFFAALLLVATGRTEVMKRLLMLNVVLEFCLFRSALTGSYL